jgi:hypothetical protein
MVSLKCRIAVSPYFVDLRAEAREIQICSCLEPRVPLRACKDVYLPAKKLQTSVFLVGGFRVPLMFHRQINDLLGRISQWNPRHWMRVLGLTTCRCSSCVHMRLQVRPAPDNTKRL